VRLMRNKVWHYAALTV